LPYIYILPRGHVQRNQRAATLSCQRETGRLSEDLSHLYASTLAVARQTTTTTLQQQLTTLGKYSK